MGWHAGEAAHEQPGARLKKLIEAAARSVNEDAPPPAELLLGLQCEHWRCLPNSGGLYDQDAGLMRRMAASLNIYRTLNKLWSANHKTIHNLSDDERKIIRMLMDMGLVFNG